MDVEQITTSKENIQPLKHGRMSKQLSEALHAQANASLELQQVFQKKIREYETLLHTYEGDDPISPWFDYLTWVEQHYPKHGKEGNYAILLNKCLTQFKDEEKYKQDPRYVGLWIKYLEMNPETSCELYEMVLNHGIGTQLAIFYHSWAMSLASAGDFQRAIQVYTMAKEVHAEPLDELDLAHKAMLHKMACKMMGSDEENSSLLPGEHRPVLSRLESTGPRNIVPHERAQPMMPLFPLHSSNRNILQSVSCTPSQKPSAKFSLFQDENREHMGPLPRKQELKMFPSHETMQTENRAKPARWTECGSSLPTPSHSVSTPFKVHSDKEPQAPGSSVRRLIPKSILQEHRISEAEWKIPLAIFEPADPSVQPMYCKDKVYAGGTEFSLEELRALAYMKRNNIRELHGWTQLNTCSQQEKVIASSRTEQQANAQRDKQTSSTLEKMMVSEIYLQEPASSFEEHYALNYARLHKLRQTQKSVQQEAQRTQQTQPTVVPAKERTYELPPNCKLCVTHKTFENGVEHSLEELRAKFYVQRCLRQPFVASRCPLKESVPVNPESPKVTPSIELVDTHLPTPPPQGQKLMFSYDKIYFGNTEFSFEEQRARQFYMLMKLQAQECSSGASTPHSSGTTPSSTPSRYGPSHSMLGQSMTVNTREAMSVVNKLWRSNYESPPCTPAPPESAVSRFAVYCDGQPPLVTPSTPFTIFADTMQQENAPPLITQEPLQSVCIQQSVSKKETSSFKWSSVQASYSLVSPLKTEPQDFVEDGENVMPTSASIKEEPGVTKSVPFSIYQDEAASLATPFSVLQDPPVQLKVEADQLGVSVLERDGHRESVPFWRREAITDDVEESPSTRSPRAKVCKWSVMQDMSEAGAGSLPFQYSLPYVPPPSEEEEVEELPNKENVSPKLYTQPPTAPKGSLGILTESTRVPFIPLEEQERMLDEEEAREEAAEAAVAALSMHPMNETEVGEENLMAPPVTMTGRFLEDVTALTSVFRTTNIVSSTPFHRNESILSRVLSLQAEEQKQQPCQYGGAGQENLPLDVPEHEPQEGPATFHKWTASAETTAAQHLSPILEMTGESRGSRSSSSSSSGGSSVLSRLHTMTSLGISKTPGQLSDSSHLAVSVERPIRMHLLQLDEDQILEEENSESISKAAMPPPQPIEEKRLEEKMAALSTRGEPIDPFSDEERRGILLQLSTSLDLRAGFFQDNRDLPALRVSQNLHLGNESIHIQRLLGSGSYAKVYFAKDGQSERPLVVKVAPSDTMCWDFYISSEIQKRLMSQPILARQFCKIDSAHVFSMGTIYLMEFSTKATLLDVVNHFKMAQPKPKDVPHELAVALGAQMLEAVSTLHQIGIIHADIKPDNFLLIPSDDPLGARLQLIDYGRCIDLSMYPSGTTFSCVLEKVDFRCIEMRTGRPWTYQLDLFALATSLHCLLFGKYMNVMETRGKWMPTCKPKRFWSLAKLLEQLFESLLNVESCEMRVDLQSVASIMRSSVKSHSVVIGSHLKTILGK